MSDRTCSIAGCERPSRKRGWCGTHYQRFLRTGDPNKVLHVIQRSTSPICSIEDCESPTFTKGWCCMHYKRWTATGDPLVTRTPTRGLSLEEAFRFYMPGDPPPAGVVWPWTGSVCAFGYGRFEKLGVRLMAHRVSYEIFKGPIPDGMFVRHTLDIPNDVNPNNLILGTQADNMRDKVERGRQPRGSSAGAAKLDEAAVHEIRRLCAEGKTSYYQLGKAFGVSASTIRAAAIGKTWAHI